MPFVVRQLKKRDNLFWGQRGISLLETLVALGILAAIGVAFMAALSTGTMSTATLDEQVQAESLARSQLEDIKNCPFSTNYPVTVDCPPGYEVSIKVQPNEDNTLQEIAVTVSREGKALLKVTDFKVNR